MRALSGAIITAGALIGLGLAALGIGIRYQGAGTEPNPHSHEPWGATWLGICLIVLLICVAIGIATTFLGLMYHHYRRHHEHLRAMGQAPTTHAGV